MNAILTRAVAKLPMVVIPNNHGKDHLQLNTCHGLGLGVWCSPSMSTHTAVREKESSRSKKIMQQAGPKVHEEKSLRAGMPYDTPDSEDVRIQGNQLTCLVLNFCLLLQ